MENEQMIKIILDYEKELRENYDENREAFGFSDESTERAVTKWLVMSELLELLKLEK
jgi:hypothetical protein